MATKKETIQFLTRLGFQHQCWSRFQLAMGVGALVVDFEGTEWARVIRYQPCNTVQEWVTWDQVLEAIKPYLT